MSSRPLLTLLGPSFLMALVGCNTVLKNHLVRSHEELLAAKRGIPWVETRQYDVYVFEGGKAPDKDEKCTDRRGNKVPCLPVPVQIYYGRHELLDEVSGVEIDPERRRWETNYEARTFSDGTLHLDFDELGALKKVELTGSSGLGDAATAASAAAGVPQPIQRNEDAEKEQELKRLQTEKSLRDARKALQE
jgi:hypothetical protein